MTTNPDRTETGPTRKGSTERCANPDCGHTKRDHSGRRDHTTKHPNIPLRPWCHACETDCLYEPPIAAVSVPPPAPRADDLRWAADRLAEEIQRGARFSHEDARQPGLAESVMLLRRWADEAGEQQTETPEAEAPTITKPETVSRGAVLVEAAAIARQESERLAVEMSGDAAYGARAVAKMLLRCLAADAPATAEAQSEDALCICDHTRSRHLRISGRLLCDECDPDSTDHLVCRGFEAL